MDVFLHDEAVYGISVDPINDNVFASACDDGKVVLYDIRSAPSEGAGTYYIQIVLIFAEKFC